MNISEVFKEPEDMNVRIWRYMDFTKLVSLLDKQALFFPQGDLLRQNTDKFEGSLTQSNIALRRQMEQEHNLQHGILDQLSKSNKDIFGQIVVINCWYMSEYESMAMWDLYMPRGMGVAIQSRFCKLSSHLKPPSTLPMIFGKVNYADYNKSPIPEWNVFAPFTYKRKSFEFEQEVRAIGLAGDLLQKDKSSALAQEVLQNKGLYVPVDLDELVENIYVSPKAPEWFFELVVSVVKKYGLGDVVRQSDMSKDPVY